MQPNSVSRLGWHNKVGSTDLISSHCKYTPKNFALRKSLKKRFIRKSYYSDLPSRVEEVGEFLNYSMRKLRSGEGPERNGHRHYLPDAQMLAWLKSRNRFSLQNKLRKTKKQGSLGVGCKNTKQLLVDFELPFSHVSLALLRNGVFNELVPLCALITYLKYICSCLFAYFHPAHCLFTQLDPLLWQISWPCYCHHAIPPALGGGILTDANIYPGWDTH